MAFTHLHVHSEFSLLDGMAKIDALLARARQHGMNALAVTDHGVMYAAVDFYLAAKAAGVKPIVGCCLPGQMVHTDRGPRPIEDIKPGDRVLTHKGRFRPVMSVTSRPYDGPIYGLQAAMCQETWLTAEHPVLVINRDGEFWVRADEVAAGRRSLKGGLAAWSSYVVLPRLTSGGLQEINLLEYLQSPLYENREGRLWRRAGYNKYDRDVDFGLPAHVPVSCDLAQFLGLVVAEGSFQRYTDGRPCALALTFGSTERHLAAFAVGTLHEVFGLSAQLIERPARHTLEVRCNSVALAQVLNAMVGSGAKYKKIPDCVWSFSLAHRSAFLEGLVAGDGRVVPRTGQMVLKMASRQVVAGVRLLVASLGYASKVSEGRRGAKTDYTVAWCPSRNYVRHVVEDDRLLLPLRHVQSRPYSGPVHNLEVAEDSSYVTEFAVHNCEVYVAPNSRLDKRGKVDTSPYHLTLLAKDFTGYRNLMQLTSKAHLEGYYYKPRVDAELLSQHGEGVIALSGCASGEAAQLLLAGDEEGARRALRRYRSYFGDDDVYVELQEHHIPEFAGLNRKLVELARQEGLPLVATCDTHYVDADDATGHEILLCIQTNTTLDDPKRLRVSGDGYHLLSPREMEALFGDLPEALCNTEVVAERCQLALPMGRQLLPPFAVPEGYTPESYLERLCREGLKRRYDRITPEITQRLAYELSVIEQTGFAQYILIVWDFTDFARRADILFGPRGSAAGSLVCYALGISDVEPLSNKLVFERFLNIERKEMPDIDIDFADDRRDEMVRYVTEKYGREHVAQIVTFGTLGARAAIRDVGRVLGLPLTTVDSVAKMIPSLPVGMTIDKAMEENPEFKRVYEADDAVRNLVDNAKRLEGVARHSSVHAAGVVISPDPIYEHVPLQRAAKSEDWVTQYTMNTVAKIGLLKMDFLGLANLTIIGRTLDLIRQQRGINLDMAAIPREDSKTFEALGRGDTMGVFQLEGTMMRRYVKELKPTSIGDLAAMVALYRPGPMAHIPKFIASKHGQEPVEYPHPLLEPILEDTYGVITFQEQVLQIVQAIAGFSLGQADIFRKVMSKKKREEMGKQRENFLAGAIKRGIDEQTATKIFDLIEPFAGYAFNRAHASCYAWVAYETAYLKANYPVEYMVAILSAYSGDTERVAIAVAEARRLGIEVLPPDINKSEAGFSIESNHQGQVIRFGLAAIKNVSSTAIENIVAVRREGGAFRSVDDLCHRIDLRTLNKRVLESLVKAGALDCLGKRGQLLAMLDKMIAFGQQTQKASAAGQSSLFDFLPAEPEALSISLPDVPDLPAKEQLAMEKELLGLYVSSHPLQQAALALEDAITCYSDQLSEEMAGQKATMAGIVVGLRQIFTKKKDTMLVAQMEDIHGGFEVVAFPRTYERTRDLWQQDAVLVLKGKVDARGEDRVQLIAEGVTEFNPPAESEAAPSPAQTATPPSAAPATVQANGGRTSPRANGEAAAAGAAPGVTVTARRAPASRLHLHITVARGADPAEDMERFKQVCALLYENNGGQDIVDLTIAANGHEAVELEFPDLRIKFTPKLQEQIVALLGPNAVAIANVLLEE